eukprot:Em0001g3115a
MDYGDPIHFTFFAVNGAGNGTKANFTYLFKKESGPYYNYMGQFPRKVTQSLWAGNEEEVEDDTEGDDLVVWNSDAEASKQLMINEQLEDRRLNF